MSFKPALSKLKSVKPSAASRGIRAVRSFRPESLWVFHYDGSGCDGCNAEYLDCLSPAWDIERLAVRNTGNPAYADVLLVTGLIDGDNADELTQIYDQLPKGSKVIAAGACACTGGLFSECRGIMAGADSIIPVDIYTAGCAARPEAFIDAIMMAKEQIEKEAELQEDADDEE